MVVPSPAFSFVLEAISLIISAPKFSTLFSISISLAIETPSLVIVGAPNPLSKTTFLPLGPIVTFTASASLSTPFFNYFRASSEYIISLAIIYLLNLF